MHTNIIMNFILLCGYLHSLEFSYHIHFHVGLSHRLLFIFILFFIFHVLKNKKCDFFTLRFDYFAQNFRMSFNSLDNNGLNHVVEIQWNYFHHTNNFILFYFIFSHLINTIVFRCTFNWLKCFNLLIQFQRTRCSADQIIKAVLKFSSTLDTFNGISMR